MSMVHGKKIVLSELSLHLLADKWLDPFEYENNSGFNANTAVTELLEFPFSYPTLNHPSTILLLKSPLGMAEAENAAQNSQNSQKSKKEHKKLCFNSVTGKWFMPAVSVQFGGMEE